MTNLLEIREQIRKFYGKYTAFIVPVVKMIFAMAVMLTWNLNLGYMTQLKNPLVFAAICLVCGILPFGAIIFVMMMLFLAHLYALSLEVAVTALVILLIMALLYYIFLPGDSVVMGITPVVFGVQLPYFMPLATGLLGNILTCIPMTFGIIIYYIMITVRDNAAMFAEAGTLTVLQKYTQLLTLMRENTWMQLLIVSFVITSLVVYAIRRLSVDYAWLIAIATGTVVNIIIILAGSFIMNLPSGSFSLVLLIFQSLLSAGFSLILHFMFFAVDYTRTEYTQFEDDEYYYYVKAVPKLAVTKSQVRVKKINKGKDEE